MSKFFWLAVAALPRPCSLKVATRPACTRRSGHVSFFYLPMSLTLVPALRYWFFSTGMKREKNAVACSRDTPSRKMANTVSAPAMVPSTSLEWLMSMS